MTEAGYSDAAAAALKDETTFHTDTRAAIKKHSGEELDVKPFEADMRHLLNTYVQADPAEDLGNLSTLHEVAHLLEPTHNDRFVAILDEQVPTWRDSRSELNELPLAAEVWRA